MSTNGTAIDPIGAMIDRVIAEHKAAEREAGRAGALDDAIETLVTELNKLADDLDESIPEDDGDGADTDLIDIRDRIEDFARDLSARIWDAATEYAAEGEEG